MSKPKYVPIRADNDKNYENSLNNSKSAYTTNLLQVLLYCFLLSLVYAYATVNYEFRQNYIDNVQFHANESAFLAPPDHTRAQKYYVNTTNCHIPYIDPFAAKLAKFDYKYRKCANDDSLVEVHYNANTRMYSLHINETAAARKAKAYNGHAENVTCCYHEIVRAGKGNYADKRYDFLPCTVFIQDFIVPSHIDFMITICRLKNSNKTEIQRDAFSFIQYKKNNNTLNFTTNRKKPSVLMIGIDTLSRINLRRTMPHTTNFLDTNRWFELQGYNKIGDNTFPNLMAVLSGYDPSTAYAQCKPKTVGGLNARSCNLIWNDFKDYGYRTAYAEDLGSISTFNYLKNGFEAQPTDYYLRPLDLAIERHLDVTKRDGLAYCIGRKHYGEYIYDYAVQFVSALMGEPYFGLFWTNSFSHNSYRTPASMDLKMLEYLETFERQGIYEEAIVVFFSDHGARFGPLLKLTEGYLEERLPMVFISLPKWFKNEHPQIVANLRVNQNRLTSNYDLYETLRHILELGEPSKPLPRVNGTIPGISIFNEIPEDRTCMDAGIADHWCTCIPYQTVSNKDPLFKKIATMVLDKINDYTSNISSLCSTLKLGTLNEALKEMKHKAVDGKNNIAYRLKFTAVPLNPEFQATVWYNSSSDTIEMNVLDVTRLNKYEDTAKCVEKDLKKYCICKA